MKKSVVSLLAFALLVNLSIISSSVQAKPLMKEVTTELIDGPFPPNEPDAGAYGIGVMHQTTIIKSVNLTEGTIEVITQSSWAVRLYEMIPTEDGFAPGKLLMILKITRVFEGSLIPDIPGGGMIEGTMVEDWVINLFGDIPELPEGDLRGHWVTRYLNGEVVRKIGFGISPFVD